MPYCALESAIKPWFPPEFPTDSLATSSTFPSSCFVDGIGLPDHLHKSHSPGTRKPAGQVVTCPTISGPIGPADRQDYVPAHEPTSKIVAAKPHSDLSTGKQPERLIQV
jgi:hypothetical protein